MKNLSAVFVAGSVVLGILGGCSADSYSEREAERRACVFLTEQIRNADQTGPIDAMETLEVMEGYFAGGSSSGDGYRLRDEIAKANVATSEESLFGNFVQMGAYCEVEYRITVE